MRRADRTLETIPPMHHSGVLGWAYRKLGRRYPATYLALELQTAFAVTAGTLALVTFYWDVDGDDFLLILGISIALTAVAIVLNFLRTYPLLRPIQRLDRGRALARALRAGLARRRRLPANLIQRDMFLPIVIVVVPSCIAAVALLGLSWIAFFPLFAGSLVAVGYGGDPPLPRARARDAAGADRHQPRNGAAARGPGSGRSRCACG